MNCEENIAESRAEIQRRIPHRGAMLLVDEILEESERSIVCGKTFLADEYFFDGHFPDAPLVPGVIQCECCLQAGAVLLAEILGGDASLRPVATRMDNVKFKQMIRPGDSVRIEIELKDQISTASFLTGKMKLGGKLAMRMDFTVTMIAAS